MSAQHTADNVLIDLHAESQRNLLSNTGTNRLYLSGVGRLLKYKNDRAGKTEIWIKDFQTGRETMIAEGVFPQISRDGRHVAYIDGKNEAIYVVTLGENIPRKVPDARHLWGLSSDGSKVLESAGASDGLQSFDIATGRSTMLVPSGLYPMVYQASFSPDDHWVSFVVKTASELSQIFISPYADGMTPERSGWIAITEGRSWEGGSPWLSDGNTMYFASDRDGFRCVWGQRLKAANHRPIGAPFTVRHFHKAQRPSMINLGPPKEATLMFAMAVDKIVYSPTQVTSNIWMIKRPIE